MILAHKVDRNMDLPQLALGFLNFCKTLSLCYIIACSKIISGDYNTMQLLVLKWVTLKYIFSLCMCISVDANTDQANGASVIFPNSPILSTPSKSMTHCMYQSTIIQCWMGLMELVPLYFCSSLDQSLVQLLLTPAHVLFIQLHITVDIMCTLVNLNKDGVVVIKCILPGPVI